MKKIMAAYKAENNMKLWTDTDNGAILIHCLDGTVERVEKEFYEIRHEIFEHVAGKMFNQNKSLVSLDTNITEELKREGMARDFVRLVQTLRKDKDFNISDRIELCYSAADEELSKALEENKEYIAEQVLAVKVDNTCSGGTKADIEGLEICFDAKVA